MPELRIGQVAERAGLATSAIRYYESVGLIRKPGRRSGQRVYEESVLDQLALIELAQSAGFTIAEIKKLQSGFARSAPPSERWRALTTAKLHELDARIAEAKQMKRVLRTVMRCHCPTLDDCSSALRKSRPQRR